MSADASARTDPNEATREALKDYLCRPKPGFAVLLAAPWGAGKTHLATTMTRGAAAMDRPLYVSLFGVGDEAGARLAMARAMMGDRAGRMETAAKFANGLAKKFTGAKLQLSLADLARFAEQPATIILDDLERSGMGQPALAGFINELVEHGGKRVILLAHGEKLWPEDGDQKEKIIGLTLPVVADVEGALPVFLAEIREPARAFLTGEEALIRETFRRANHHNLRALRQVLFDISRIHAELGEDLRKAADGMREFLRLYLALALEVKAGKLGREDLKRRGEIGDRSKPEFEKLREVSRNHDGDGIQYGYYGVLPEPLSQNLLLDGRVDATELRNALVASGRFLVPDEEDWQIVWWSGRRDPRTVAEAYAAMERRFEARDYHEPGVMLHVFHQRMRARWLGLSSKALPEIEAECQAYVDDLARMGVLGTLDPGRARDFDRSGYCGLGYPYKESDDPYPEETKIFWGLHDYLKQVRIGLFEQGLQARADAIVGLIREGRIDEAAAELWQNERGREGASRRIPVLSDLDPETLAAAICENSGEKLFLLGMIFKERYAQSGNALDDELTWLPSLVKALESVAEKKRETEPVHAWQIAENILGNLRIALRARKPDES